MSAQDIDRRQLLGAALLTAVLVGPPLTLAHRPGTPESGEASDEQIAMLRRVSDVVIPRTDTPGASDVGVPEFVALALSHGLEGTRGPAGDSTPAVPPERALTRPQAGLQLLDWLADALASYGVLHAATAPGPQVAAAVGRIDDAAFAPAGADSPWHKIKSLILLGYYTSQAGATQELRYELVPGRWDPDLPAGPHDRAWSSDWTALTFG